ncbi:translation initiation factor IF-2 [Patescibacteria group bacterium]|nr:translation initiation factor IF-2 [Patescibacteria group bacterium]
MNVSDLARRLKITPQELLEKLPELGFDIGQKAIKIDNQMAEKIFRKWMEVKRRERLRGQLLVSSKNDGPGVGEDGEKKQVSIPSIIVVRELAGVLGLPVTRVIQELMRAGILASQNERLDYETAAVIADELGFEATQVTDDEKSEKQDVESQDRIKEILSQEAEGKKASRPPVVVVMGHVDHGKTRTLDAIRRTNVMEGEAGGITQHIGAYQATRKGRQMTFIDTPGHEAFTVMRSRGAKVADIAVLVVAVDDGVQPQTKEVIDIIKAAKIPFVVALNKMDKEGADPDRVLAQLAEVGVLSEAWGGKVPIVKISAKKGEGIDDLLEMILLLADINADNIQANPDRLAFGTIIESHVDKAEGPVATVLIQSGTLHKNDFLAVRNELFGRVRSMRNWLGEQILEATPGVPAKILGFRVAPSVGDIMEVPEDPKSLEKKKSKGNYQLASQFTAVKSIKTEAEQNSEDKKKELNVVIKADVLGSLEAILGMLEKIDHEAVEVNIIKKGLGNITENDIEEAANNQPSVVYGFNTVAMPAAAAHARESNVEIKQVKIIYELIDDVIVRLNALLPPEVIKTDLGKAEVVAIFRTEKERMVVGCKVRHGELKDGAKMIIWRKEGDEEQPVGEGVIESLQVGKEKVKDVQQGQECGLSYHGKEKIQVGDRLDVYSEESKVRKVEAPR